MSNVTESAHPSVERLRTFGLGQLDEAEASAIEEHVSQCEACCRTLAGVGSDTFIDVLRLSRASGAIPELTLGLSPDAPADAAPLGLPPELLSHPRYRVLALLGAGGMGTVYKAEHRLMERVVALKVMNRAVVGSAATVERFRREFRASALLSHPNIVPGYDAEQAGDVHFLVMEYVEGTDLARWVAERGPLPVAEACDYVRQAARGLQHAHEHGMIHRDIKPHNLMRTPDGTVKVLDFGLARLAAEAGTAASGVTGQGTLLGTVDYLAPEQADDARQADIRSDVYSLGCTLYFLLSGRPPFPQGTVVQKIMAHTQRQALSLHELRPDLPPGLTEVVERMMAKSPEERYQTPDDVWAALAPFVGQTVVLNPAPAPKKLAAMSKESSASWRRRWSVAVAVLLMALVGLIAGAGVVFYIKTDNGTIEINTDDENVKIIAECNGKQLTVLDPKSKQSWVVDTGEWTVRLDGNPDGLKLEMPDRFTLKRGDKQVVTIKRMMARAEKVGEVRRFEAHTQAVWGVAFSPDGRYALSTSSDWGIRLWDLQSGKEVRAYLGHTDNADAVAFAPDGREFLSCGKDRTIRLWDVETGKELNRAALGEDMLSDVMLSPDGKLALVSCADKILYLWDVKNWKELRRFEGHTDRVQRAVFSADGRRALSAGWDKTMRLWDVETGKELKCFEGHQGYVMGVALSPDGRLALSGAHGDKPMRLWDVATGKELRQFEGHTDYVDGVAFSPDGRLALSCSADRSIRLWEVATGKELQRFDGHQAGVYSVVFSRDGRYALSGSQDRTMRLWRLPDPQPAEKVGQVHLFEGHKDIVHGIAVSRDGRYAVSGGGYKFRDGKYVDGAKDYDIRLWDLTTRTEVRHLSGTGAPVWSVALSPDGRRVLSGGGNPTGAIRLLDAATGKELKHSEDRETAVWSVAFSPDGLRALDAADEDNDFRLRDVESGKEIRRFKGHTKAVRRAVFSSDGRRALSASYDGTARLWDVETGKELKKFEGHQGWVNGVAFSPDGRRVLTGGDDRTVRLWDAESGKEVKRFEGHKSNVLSVAFSPDGRFALSAGGGLGAADEEDFSLRLWNLESGKELHRFEGHKDVVEQVLWLPDGLHALSCSWDTTVRLWRMPDPPAK